MNFFPSTSSPATKLLAPSIVTAMPAITELTIRLFITIPFDNLEPDCEGASIIGHERDEPDLSHGRDGAADRGGAREDVPGTDCRGAIRADRDRVFPPPSGRAGTREL